MVGFEGAFNQQPLKCQGICEITQDDINKHGIVLTKNCDGPSYEGDHFKDSTRVRDGEVLDIAEIQGSTLGRVACTNRGVNLWLQNKQDIFRQETKGA
jgi:hypothetical protein